MLIVKKFSTKSCSPCQMLSAQFPKLRSEFPQVIFQDIDADLDKNTTKSYGITSVPTVIFEKNGQIVAQIIGAKPLGNYAQIIKQNLN
jgi:thioredoxin 1